MSVDLNQGVGSSRAPETRRSASSPESAAADRRGPGAAVLDRQLEMLDLGPSVRAPDGGLGCGFLGWTLSSAFQPIVRAADRTPYSYEALLRGRDGAGRAVSPLEIFDAASRAGEQRRLDRAARLLHVSNFHAQASPHTRLFLNVHGQHIETRDVAHGEFFAAALAEQRIAAETITIEILESSIDDFGALVAAVDSFKAFGFRIAIDDFGARHSNFDRMWRLNPDYVKIDSTLIAEATRNPRARLVLPKIIEIVHDLGGLVVCEGIEEDVHAAVAADGGADFLQGYLCGRPQASIL